MAEDEKIDNKGIQIEEQPHHQNHDSILTKNTNGKTIVTEI